MDLISQVQHRRALGQIQHVALGRVNEDLLLEEIALDGGDQRDRIGAELLIQLGDLRDPADQLAHPFRRAAVYVLAARRPLQPERRDAMLGGAMHLMGADVYLGQAPLQRKDHGVEGLVAVGLGSGDVVAVAVGAPKRVDDGERAVAVVRGRQQDAESEQIVEQGNVGAVLVGLTVGAIGVFDAPVDGRHKAVTCQLQLQPAAEPLRPTAAFHQLIV